MLRLLTFPFRLAAGTTRMGWRVGRLVGGGRLLAFGVGVGTGVLIASPGARLTARRVAGSVIDRLVTDPEAPAVTDAGIRAEQGVAMKLWPDEYESLLGEAREVVGGLLGALADDAFGSPAATGSTDEKVKASRDAVAAFFAPLDEAEVRDIAGVPCRVFTPDGPASAVYLHFHGGGMIIGAPEMNDLGNRALCRDHGLAVVSVDYRLAPEHPHPAGPDDGVAVATWLLAHAEAEFGSGRLLLGGESAGGYMAAMVALRIRDEVGAIERVAGLELVFGVFDWGRSPSQRGLRPCGGPDLLDPAGIEFFTDCYLPGLTDDERRDPSVSPAFADLIGMPPARFSVGTGDHLVDDTLWLSSRWAAAGNDTDLWVGPDLPHGFTWFPCELTRRAETHMTDWFTRILA